MKNLVLGALLVLNLALVLSLVSSHWPGKLDNPAMAQARRPGDYLMIPGDISGGATGVVYILDMQNGTLGAMAFEDSNGRISFMPPLNLNQIFEAGPQIYDRRGRSR